MLIFYNSYKEKGQRDDNIVRVALNDSTGKHAVFNMKDLWQFTPDLNYDGCVFPVGEEEIQSRLHWINGYEQMF